jgi:trimeric autotransporter adhesin
MAQTIQIKRSTTTATPTSLANGELAYSADSGKLFIGNPGGAAGDVYAVGGKFFTDIIAGATASSTADKLVLRDGSGNFAAGTITANLTGNVSGNAGTVTNGVYTSGDQTIGGTKTFSATISGSIDGNAGTVTNGVYTSGDQTIAGVKTFSSEIGADISGNADGNAGTATKWATARNLSLSGDATATLTGVDGSAAVSGILTLATVNSNVGSFGGTSAVPVITVNAKGLVTGVSTTTIATSFSVAADTGTTDVVSGGETLTFSGGTGVATTVGPNEVTFAIGQAVGTTDNVTFNNVAVNGTFTSDDIQAATLTASGNVVVTGNLTVNGTTTTVNSNTVAIGDNILVLNTDEAGTPTQNAGIEIERGTSLNASILWNETADYWQIYDGVTTSKILTAGNFAASFTGVLDGGSF